MTELSDSSPARLGYSMPAEWEPHEGTWLSWPHNLATWPEELERVEDTMARVAAVLSRHESVHINVNHEEHAAHVRTLLARAGAAPRVTLHLIPTDDAWIRDHGAIFLQRSGREAAAVAWGFNSWGEKYPPWENDNRAPARMAEAAGVPCFSGGMILEGGSIDVNGAGTLLTTESCLLNPNRNPALSREQIEDRLKGFLGVEQIVWLGDGIAGDDTDGHVDDITRFVGPDTVVTVIEEDPTDPNFEPLQDNLDHLRRITLPGGRPLRVATLPMPSPVYCKGERMPASYANFYIANGLVLMPAYNDPMDSVAMRTLRELFPQREVIAFDCTELIWGLGALHCLTQQVPDAVQPAPTGPSMPGVNR